MKYVALILSFFLFSTSAQAGCSGGFDGNNGSFYGCSEMGGLGNLVYERDESGRVLRKRSDREIKQYLIDTVEKRMKNRGITMSGKGGQSSISINTETIVFDLFNQNGEKIYTYTIDLEKGIPLNEKDVIESRQKYDEQKGLRKAERLSRLQQLQALGDKIKAEEIDKKAAAKK